MNASCWMSSTTWISTRNRDSRATRRAVNRASAGEGMEIALGSGEADAAQLVAAECVVQAETKDHLNWELIGQCAKETRR
jgi:hypothetical protein